MSKYTVSLRELIDYYDRVNEEENKTGRQHVEEWFKDFNETDYITQAQLDVIKTAGIWNKDKMASMIVDHYFMREIGYETPKLFELMTKVKMRELMGYYLPLIYTASIDFDPLVNVNYTEVIGRTTSNQGQSSSSANSSGLAINSDTPQGQINKEEILQGKYATSTNASETTGTSSDNASSSGKEDITRTRKGNDGVMATAQKLIEQYRDIIRNINYEIIKDLSDMFIGLY